MNFAKHCASAYVQIGVNIGGNRVVQSDFPSYLSHSAWSINPLCLNDAYLRQIIESA